MTIILVSMMRLPLVFRLGNRTDMEQVIHPSGLEIVLKFSSLTTHMAGECNKIALVNEVPLKALGIPDKIDPALRYIVPPMVFEHLDDRKDFVTPARPIRDTHGIIRAYHHLRGHQKQEVLRFYEEAEASRKGGTT